MNTMLKAQATAEDPAADSGGYGIRAWAIRPAPKPPRNCMQLGMIRISSQRYLLLGSFPSRLRPTKYYLDADY